jgi:anhydro-N-acetylmuramic acid kinase
LSAKTIAQAYERFILPEIDIEEVVLGGGGAYNPTLKNFLRVYLPDDIKLLTHEDYGISNNYKEAMAFALLGYCTYYSIPNNLPECTGAARRVVMGKMANGI